MCHIYNKKAEPFLHRASADICERDAGLRFVRLCRGPCLGSVSDGAPERPMVMQMGIIPVT